MPARFHRLRTITLVLLLSLPVTSAVLSTGCSTRTTTTTRSENVEQADADSAVQTQTTTERQIEGPSYGIISGTFHLIGFILALPFKIVGGIIQLIF